MDLTYLSVQVVKKKNVKEKTYEEKQYSVDPVWNYAKFYSSL